MAKIAKYKKVQINEKPTNYEWGDFVILFLEWSFQKKAIMAIIVILSSISWLYLKEK